MTKQAWIAEAHEWVGTPFRWQGRIKQDGTDCWGLIVGVAHAVGYIPAEWDYRIYSRRDDMVALANSVLPEFFTEVPVAEMEPGDVVCFNRATGPVHMGILYDHPDEELGIIHSEDWVKIVEHGLSDQQRAAATQAWRPRYDGQ
jgi:cell wall-associated NlpC family hydrolase